MLQRSIGSRILRQSAEKSQAYTLGHWHNKLIRRHTKHRPALNLALPGILK